MYKFHLFEEKDLFTKLFPNTELGIELKLITSQPGRLGIGAAIPGVILHDAEEHYVFVEFKNEQELIKFFQVFGAALKGKKTDRNVPVYQGTYLNVNRDDHGSCRPFFKQIYLNEVTDIDKFVTHVCQELYMAWFSLREKGCVRN